MHQTDTLNTVTRYIESTQKQTPHEQRVTILQQQLRELEQRVFWALRIESPQCFDERGMPIPESRVTWSETIDRILDEIDLVEEKLNDHGISHRMGPLDLFDWSAQ